MQGVRNFIQGSEYGTRDGDWRRVCSCMVEAKDRSWKMYRSLLKLRIVFCEETRKSAAHTT